MKRAVLTAGAGLMCFVLLFYSHIDGSFAWFSDEDERSNLLTSGQNDVVIEEEFPDPKVTPGAELKKEVTFTNTGTVPCYVRAKYDFSSLEAEEQTQIQFGSALWTRDDDGYYYYEKSVAPGEKTEPFLTALRIKEDASSGQDFDLTIYTETVQAEDDLSPRDAFAQLTG